MTLASRVAVLSMHTSPLAPLGGAATGGMNVYVHEVSERLGARGHAIDVFTRREDPLAPAVIEFAPGARLVQIETGPAAPLPTGDLIPLTDEFAAGVEAFRGREARRYELVHSHYWLSAVAGERLAADWRVPHLGMFHTLGEVKLRARASEHEPSERLEAERRLVHTLDRVVAATSYEQRLLRAHQLLPEAAFGADVMVGFPGENDEDFEQTRALVERLPFTYLHVFTYSRREGTPAAAMADQVHGRVARERNRILRELAARKNLEFRRRQVGSRLSVITLEAGTLEGVSALSDNYLKVRLRGSRLGPNRLVEALITGVEEPGLAGVVF